MKKVIILIITIFCLSNSYSQITNIETGYRIGQDVDKSNQGTLQNLKNLAYEKQQKKDYLGAILLYDKVIEMEPDNPLNYFQRGHYKYWSNQYEECIKDMNLGLKFDKNESLLYYYRALANIKLNRLETVCGDLKKGQAETELLKKHCK
jgi:tetratricopeptide (TPR) repeat protein